MKKISLSTLFIWLCSMAFSQITLTSTVTNVSCFGLANGSATITAIGGVSPYTYSWTPSGATTPTSTSLPAGTYSAIVMDAMANTNTITVTISQPQMLNIVMSQTNTTCNGSCDGAIDLLVTGGTPPYMYQWSIGSITPNQTALCASDYSVSITDSNWCTSNSTATITSGVSPTISVNSGTICSGSSGITLNANGATSFTWSPILSLNTSMGASVIATPSTTIVYTVSGSIGSCISSATTTVTVHPSPIVSFSLTQNATPNVWDIIPSYSGGSGPYTYIWSFGDGSPNSTLPYPSHTYTTAGWYNICVTMADLNGCASTTCLYDSLYKMSSSNSMITVNVINGLTTNINQNTTNNNSISIYPNPTNSFINIDDKNNQFQNSTIEIKNYLGQIVFTTPFTSQINLSNLSVGMYFLTIQDKSSSKTVKIIKE